MKKNRMMRSASALLVMVLMTTSVISGTFAKYVTTNKAEDVARVAKWGVTVDASGNLFGQNYLDGEVVAPLVPNLPTTNETDDQISVEAEDSSTDKLVAPGTKSEHGLTFGIKGQPEVDTKVSMIVAAKDIYLAEGTYGVMQQVTVNETNYEALVTAGLYTYASSAYTKLTAGVYDPAQKYYQLAYTAIVNHGGYYPVKYTWNTTVQDNAAAMALGIAKKIDSTKDDSDDSDTTIGGAKYTVTKEYDSNTVLATAIDLEAESITWQWAFGMSEEDMSREIGEAVVPNSDDARDTILGDLMANADSNNTVVAVDNTGAVTVLTIDNKIVKNNGTEVGCLETKFDIKITVEQVD